MTRRARWTRGRRRLVHQARLARLAHLDLLGQKERLGREETWT